MIRQKDFENYATNSKNYIKFIDDPFINLIDNTHKCLEQLFTVVPLISEIEDF